MPLPTPHSPANLDALLDRLPGASVAVFGDFCLDAYWLIEPRQEHVSVETGLPVRCVRSQRYSLGGAGNVVANLVDLGLQTVSAIGAVGDDLFGGEMLRLLRARNVSVDGMLSLSEPWQTMVYAKPCIGEVEDSRLDFGSFNVLPAAAINTLMESLDRAAAAHAAVVLNQQIPGGVSPVPVIERINQVIAAHPGTQFIVDARHRPEMYKGATLKINVAEAQRLAGDAPLPGTCPLSLALDLAVRLLDRTRAPVFLTLGENGMVVADATGVTHAPAQRVDGPTDPVGAGDTAVAMLAAVLATGGSPQAAAAMANLAAAVTVRKLQTTGTATPAEIRRAAGAGRKEWHDSYP